MKKVLLLAIVLIVGCGGDVDRWQYVDENTKFDKKTGYTYKKVIDQDAIIKKYYNRKPLDSSTIPEDVKNDLNKFLEANPKYSDYSDYELYKYLKTSFSYPWVKGSWKEADNYVTGTSIPTDSIIYHWVKQ